MKPVVCPNNKLRCGRDSPQIYLFENQTETVEISKWFDEQDSCRFTLSGGDKLTTEQVGLYNRRWLQVYFETFDGLDIFVASAKHESELGYGTKVGLSSRNFTAPPDEHIFVQIQATNNTRFGQYSGKMTFKYYIYDPKCAEYTYWNGTECEANYDEYCNSLTDAYIKQTGDPTTTVVYNGTACVVANKTKMEEDRNRDFVAANLVA